MITELPIINQQSPSSLDYSNNGLLVHSIFDTIQGEGPFAGRPATFIRLAGCNLQCPMCDTEYTANAKRMTTEEIIRGFTKSPDKSNYRELFVITGGEPFRQNFSELARTLVYTGNDVQVETNGTLWQDEIWPVRFTIVCSPKTPKINPEISKRAIVLKYVIRHDKIDPKDGLPTSVLGLDLPPARPPYNFKGQVYIQPEDDRDPETNRKNLEACVNISKQFGYVLGVQLHKIIGAP